MESSKEIRPGMKLGVTGGIGSGKTSVCRVFKVLGIPVFSADPEARTIMINDPVLLNKINTLVHPVVFEHFIEWTGRQSAPYVIMEAAILFESGGSKLVDRVATVTAPVEERIARVTARNKLTREQVLDRIRNQMDDNTRINMSDYVINNSENEMIIPVILQIHDDILNHLNS
jgi:dephospho-CoA kinase